MMPDFVYTGIIAASMGTAGQRLHTLGYTCENGTDHQRQIGNDAIGCHTCVALQLQDNKVKYDNNNAGGKLCNQRWKSEHGG